MSNDTPKLCPELGCGLPLEPDEVFHLRWVCGRNSDAHELCRKLAESEAKVAALEAKLAEVSKPCEWAEDEDEGLWTATCGLVDWCFNDGGPIENRVHFCVGCGHPVVVKEAR